MTADLSPLGIAVGHASDFEGGTGVTVVRGTIAPFRCGVTVLGRATGTRELDVVGGRHLVDRVDALVLTGGSAYGLGCADGVMRWMEERARGFAVTGGIVPIVPAAVIFDLAPIGRFDARPTPVMAYAACDQARSSRYEEGSVGAGTGATVGKATGLDRCMKGGFGCAAAQADGVHVAAMTVVNALGDVRDADNRIIAGARDPHGGFADAAQALRALPLPAAPPLQQTTLAVIATNAHLDRIQLAQLASAASAALYRRITPAGTSFDGDIIFAIAPEQGVRAAALQVEALAVQALERAIERAVRLARTLGGVPGLGNDG